MPKSKAPAHVATGLSARVLEGEFEVFVSTTPSAPDVGDAVFLKDLDK